MSHSHMGINNGWIINGIATPPIPIMALELGERVWGSHCNEKLMASQPDGWKAWWNISQLVAKRKLRAQT